jgi:AraC family transcriptional regulator of adaptative response/methylated-DNA-[protein]-cysteine methyltransferase
LTFQAYCRARRLAGAFERIRDGRSVDDAVFETGYESHSGFREAFGKVFGKPPATAAGKLGAPAAECVRVSWVDTPIGPMIAGATDAGLCLLEFTDRRMLEHQFDVLQRRFKTGIVPGAHRYLAQLERELSEYFAGTRIAFDVPVHAPGSPFEERVWRALCEIPFGETRSYEDIARAVGSPKGVRAVGRANGLNRIARDSVSPRGQNSGELGAWRRPSAQAPAAPSSNEAASYRPTFLNARNTTLPSALFDHDHYSGDVVAGRSALTGTAPVARQRPIPVFER